MGYTRKVLSFLTNTVLLFSQTGTVLTLSLDHTKNTWPKRWYAVWFCSSSVLAQLTQCIKLDVAGTDDTSFTKFAKLGRCNDCLLHQWRGLAKRVARLRRFTSLYSCNSGFIADSVVASAAVALLPAPKLFSYSLVLAIFQARCMRIPLLNVKSWRKPYPGILQSP